MHCCLATGGPGAATPHAPFGRPRRPLGTFPRGESTSSARRRTKPPTRNKFLVKGRKRAYLSFLASQKVSPLRRRPGGFPLAPWTPSGPIPVYMGETSHKKQISCDRQETGLPFFPRVTNTFAFAEATKGLSARPLGLFGSVIFSSSGWRSRNIKNPRSPRPKAAEAGVLFFPKVFPFPVNPSSR